MLLLCLALAIWPLLPKLDPSSVQLKCHHPGEAVFSLASGMIFFLFCTHVTLYLSHH